MEMFRQKIKKVMANFNNAIKFVLAKEGGYQSHPNDRGNYNSQNELIGTNMGISAPVLERHLGRVPTEQDMKALTQATAKEIYRRNFWNPIQGDKLVHDSTAIAIFDWFVNAGRPAIIKAQEVVNVGTDGVVGRITLKALNEYDPKKFFNEYQEKRVEWYKRLTDRRPSLRVFLNGWLSRISSLTNFITKKDENVKS
jgi:lysozyme family protein